MLDRYSWGTVDRISPEAPIPVLKLAREEVRLGGAGNVVMNLKTLGCNV
ncbi:MAG: D-glycero-beta-D-manno-heptose-7-phosphate kinase, partial [SAR324 cluster bacterium]|nr:D-glycero-beta-D-manno-heptose-7-phosphate kinase [SAR324 cluster bacterium]